MVAVIYKTSDLQVIGVCDGPEPGGRCPRALSDGRVFCAGYDIVLTRDEAGARCRGLKRERFSVSQLSICPLANAHAVCGREYFSPFLPASALP
jgi:hypothetical protein